jgi:cell division protein FtsB
MTLDLHFVVTVLLGGVCGVLGWFGRELWAAVQQLRRDLAALEVRIGQDYIRYDRLQDAIRPILEKLQRIEDALAHKADKT